MHKHYMDIFWVDRPEFVKTQYLNFQWFMENKELTIRMVDRAMEMIE